ncbi:MAG TPA: hypothetical protein VGH27_09565 [Streptosporangiaceae bacterium]|jgi:hypothetical protein
MTMPRPSLVTSSGPSPVRGFIAAILYPFLHVPRGTSVPAATEGPAWTVTAQRGPRDTATTPC